ncbi:MAG: histidine phosphatase family protein [Dehalococcoidia bacterium]
MEVVLTRFILVRHGETEWNREERFRGRADLPLNSTGVRQAEAAALNLRDRDVAAIYSSPLKRSAETAGILSGKLSLPVEIAEGLVDIDFGRWQGLSAGEASGQDSELYARWLESPHEVRFPGGESLEDVRKRVVTAVDEAAVKHSKQTVVLVSHKVVCQVLLCAMLGIDNSHFWQVRQDVCAINIFEIRNGFPIVSLVNDTCHLKSLAAG